MPFFSSLVKHWSGQWKNGNTSFTSKMPFHMRKRLGPVLIGRSFSDQGKTFVEARSDNHAENDYDNSHDLHETLIS